MEFGWTAMQSDLLLTPGALTRSKSSARDLSLHSKRSAARHSRRAGEQGDCLETEDIREFDKARVRTRSQLVRIATEKHASDWLMPKTAG
jgi:hypothetical protein